MITETSGLVNVPLGEDATLMCQAKGNPLEESMMKWRRNGYSFAGTEQTFEYVLHKFGYRANERNKHLCMTGIWV